MTFVTPNSPSPEHDPLAKPAPKADFQQGEGSDQAPDAQIADHEFDLDADASPYALLAPSADDATASETTGAGLQPDHKRAPIASESDPADAVTSHAAGLWGNQSTSGPNATAEPDQVAKHLEDDVPPVAESAVTESSAAEAHLENSTVSGADCADANGPTDQQPHHIEFGTTARPVRRLMPLAASSAEFEPGFVPGKRRPTTVGDYEYRVKLLYRHSGARRTVDPQMPHAANPLEVVEDLIDSVTGPAPRSAASWRVNRAALLYHLAANRNRSEKFTAAFEKLSSVPARLASEIPEVDTTIDLTTPRFDRKPRRGHGIPLDDMILLLNTLTELNTPSSQVGSYVQFWLQAGVIAGPRIAEWTGVTWADREKGLLSVPNAKLKAHKPASWAIRAARASGQNVRTVHDLDTANIETEDYSANRAKRRIVHISQDDAFWVDLHLSAMWSAISKSMSEGATVDEGFKNYYDRCRNLLLTACKIAFRDTRSYTLRMTRSQFAANSKLEFTLEEVAELMGHATTTTTRGHYAPRRSGWRRNGDDGASTTGDRLKQVRREVASVRNRNLGS